MDVGRFLQLFGILTVFYGVLILASDDLYSVIGVDKTATTQEIRKAYKKLARELHPDKNKAPDANDKFMKINEAYEILTDAEKRKEYDNFGYVNVNSPHPHQARRESYEAFQDFFGGSFKFHFGGENYNKYHMTYRSWRLNIREETFWKPYVVLVTGHMCLRCMQLEPLWERLISDLETIGLGIGTFNTVDDQRLAGDLKAHHYPQFIGIIKGRSTFYKGDYTLQGLRDFVRGFFPNNLVQKIDDRNYARHLAGWPDNKVRVLLFGHQNSLPLRYLALAYQYKDRLSAGYVRIGDLSADLESTYRLSVFKETMMIFGEDVRQPMASASMNRISRQTMNDMILANKYLILPRLSSPQIFNDLCPIEASQNLRKLCVVLVTSQSIDHDSPRHSYREHAKSFLNQHRVHRNSVQFAYIYTDTQTDFMDKLSLSKRPRNESILQVVIIWRSGSKQISFDWLRDGWSLNSDDVIMSERHLDVTIEDLLHHRKVFIHTAQLPQLTDEHSQIIVVRMWYKILDWCDQAMDKFNGLDQRGLYYIMLTCVFVMFAGYLMSALLHAEADRCEAASANTSKKTTPQEQKSKANKDASNSVFIRDLRPANFESMFMNAGPGTMTILIVVDADSKPKLLQQFGKIIWPYSQNKSLTFAYVMIEERLSWYKQLLEESLLTTNLDNINAKNVIGTVLAINGHRRYYCMYHAKHPQKKKHRKKRRPIDFIGLEDETSGSDDCEYTGSIRTDPSLHLFHEDLLLDLPNWFDRLYEGSLRRIKLQEWPLML